MRHEIRVDKTRDTSCLLMIEICITFVTFEKTVGAEYLPPEIEKGLREENT